MVALRPEVEKFGLVLPSRNRPHAGWPRPAQPSGLLARSSISRQPSFFLGQPSASAIGRGIAITSGDAAIRGTSGGTRLGRSLRLPRCCSRRSEEHTSELQSHHDLVCRLLLEKKKTKQRNSQSKDKKIKKKKTQ